MSMKMCFPGLAGKEIRRQVEVYRIEMRCPACGLGNMLLTGKLQHTGQLSGVALQILYGPLVAKTQVKRLLYGPMLQEVMRCLLVMGGRKPQTPNLYWPEVLPKDALQERQTALIDEQLGVSQDTLLQKLGYDPGREREKKEANMDTMAERMMQAFDAGEGADFGGHGGSQSVDERR